MAKTLESNPRQSGLKKPKSHHAPHIIIEKVFPLVDGGKYPAKAIVGETYTVEADIFRHGNDIIRAVVKWRRREDSKYSERPMTNTGNDRWRGEFSLKENSRYFFTIEAWTDRFASWFCDFKKRVDAGQQVESEVLEGITLIKEACRSAYGYEKQTLMETIDQLEQAKTNPPAALHLVSNELIANLMANLLPREDAVVFSPESEIIVDRSTAIYGNWYEFFIRSQGTVPGQIGTFKDAEKRLDDIQNMGFDVLYLAPFHPIGRTGRKGPNNSLNATDKDPGCPWAVGNEQGGHTAIDPALGSFDDFSRFVKKAQNLGIDLAMDFAVQCSPDHPWVKEHPEWFYKRPDGTIKYAENPPMKYEDIFPLNFNGSRNAVLWDEIKNIFLFWISRGIKIFRIDNPHTKPFPFWKWLIEEIQKDYPEVIFLAEAFTRPKIMKALSKIGFSQSYTYFTWRNEKWEIIEYLKELTTGEMPLYFRPNFFCNTPDNIGAVLQNGGRPAFKMRLALAATTSPSYGIYSGYELCENNAFPGTEDYRDSEKYEIKVRDWNAPGHIKDYIAKLNSIRSENPAFKLLNNLQFFTAENNQILFFCKKTPDFSNVILVAINLDPFKSQQSNVFIPLDQVGVRPGGSFEVCDLITGQRFTWGDKAFIELNPHVEPAHILKIENRF